MKGTPTKSPPSANHQQETTEVTDVCCGCRPASRRRFRRIPEPFGIRRMRLGQFQDSSQDPVDQGGHDGMDGEIVMEQSPLDHNDSEDEDGLFFFDACENPLADDEYPYYISITDYLRPKRDVSMKNPFTMLRKNEEQQQQRQQKQHSNNAAESEKIPLKHLDKSEADTDDECFIHRPSFKRHVSEPISSHKSRSQRFLTLTSRSTVEQERDLKQPRVKITQRGFPGDLTLAELNECQHFLRGLKNLDPAISEQVYSFRDIEEEPYTICRWLRATKFDASAILQRLEDNQTRFAAAKDQEFFPNVDEAIGAPFSVFLSQFPFLPVGRGKNGCPVNYFQAGRIHPEGILSLSTPEKLEGYFWWSFMWKFKAEIRKAQERDSDFVRVEGINIIDLYGLSSESLSSETIDVVKLSSKISDFFPETLHCMLIINAPTFFSMFWGLLKKFIDPRTAQRIQVFSNASKGLAALRKLVDEDEIPADYGGTNKSIKQAFVDEASDPLLKRQEIELLYVKKKGSVSLSKNITLNKNEYLQIKVYTRSVTSANVNVSLDGKSCAKAQAKCLWKNNEDMRNYNRDITGNNMTPTNRNSINANDSSDGQTVPLPNCTLVVRNLQGPGTVAIQVEDLDRSSPSDTKGRLSRGYFLVVCDVRSNQG